MRRNSSFLMKISRSTLFLVGEGFEADSEQALILLQPLTSSLCVIPLSALEATKDLISLSYKNEQPLQVFNFFSIKISRWKMDLCALLRHAIFFTRDAQE